MPTECLSLDDLKRLQTAARTAVFVDHGVQQYAVDLVTATRDPARFGLGELAPFTAIGVSSRATLGLIAAGPALALLLRRRPYVLPQDVWDVAPDVLTHRLVVSYDALAQGVEAEHIVTKLLSTVTAPRLTPTQDATAHPVPPAPPATGPTSPGRHECRLHPGRLHPGHHRAGNHRPADRGVAGPPPPAAGEIVRRLELTLGRRVDGLLHGDHIGRVPGLGTEAGESRRYVPGDDPRIDWNVTARAQVPTSATRSPSARSSRGSSST